MNDRAACVCDTFRPCVVRRGRPVQLEAGYRIVPAPRFAESTTRLTRVRLNQGVAVESDGRFFPRDSWRPLDQAESTLLSAAPAAATFPRDDVGLFSITERLRTRWWDMAGEAARSSPGKNDWFSAYTRELHEFARFKGLPLPAGCVIDAVVSPAGQRSTRSDRGRGAPRLAGLSFSVVFADANDTGAGRDSGAGWRGLGGINLSDEPTSIVFLNLSPQRMAQWLVADGLDEATSRDPGEVARRFLTRFSAYPVVQLTLNPCEGYWWPVDGIVYDGDTRNRRARRSCWSSASAPESGAPHGVFHGC